LGEEEKRRRKKRSGGKKITGGGKARTRSFFRSDRKLGELRGGRKRKKEG